MPGFSYQSHNNDVKMLAKLIGWAITSEGKTHPHQCQVEKTAKANLELFILNNFEELSKVIKFHDLYKMVNKIKGIGPLAADDASIRVGACIGLVPDKVYLHQGAREGARNLLRDKMKNKRYLKVKDFPVELHSLTPAQLENFLCMYKDTFLQKSVS